MNLKIYHRDNVITKNRNLNRISIAWRGQVCFYDEIYAKMGRPEKVTLASDEAGNWYLIPYEKGYKVRPFKKQHMKESYAFYSRPLVRLLMTSILPAQHKVHLEDITSVMLDLAPQPQETPSGQAWAILSGTLKVNYRPGHRPSHL